MRIAGYEFVDICVIEPQRETDGSVRQFAPQSLYKNARNLPLNTYGTGPFCKFKITSSLQASGVYVLSVDAKVRYVGECANLSKRFSAGYGNISPKNCYKGGQETNCRLNNLVYSASLGGERIVLSFFRTADYKRVEASLRSTLKPIWNRV
jgi:hypothetical protein